MSLNCHRNNCNTPGMEASRAAELACTGALFPRFFPAHPLPGVTVQPGNTACFTLQLACDGAQKGCHQGKITAQCPLSASCPDSASLTDTGDQGSWKHHILILTTFNSVLFNEPRNGRTLHYIFNQHCSPRLRNSPLGRTLMTSQITNTRDTWNLCISGTLRYLQLLAILPCPLPCAFPGFFPRAQNCNPRVVPSTNWAASPGTCTLFHWRSLVCCLWQVFLSVLLLPAFLQNSKLLWGVIRDSARQRAQNYYGPAVSVNIWYFGIERPLLRWNEAGVLLTFARATRVLSCAGLKRQGTVTKSSSEHAEQSSGASILSGELHGQNSVPLQAQQASYGYTENVLIHKLLFPTEKDGTTLQQAEYAKYKTRIPDWLGLEGTSKEHLVPLPAMGRDTFHYPSRMLSNLALGTTRDPGAATAVRTSPPSQGRISS